MNGKIPDMHIFLFVSIKRKAPTVKEDDVDTKGWADIRKKEKKRSLTTLQLLKSVILNNFSTPPSTQQWFKSLSTIVTKM